MVIPVIIPAYEPDERLLTLLQKLNTEDLKPVIVVNDGSGEKYDALFEKALELIGGNGGVLLKHEINQGKGAALKTAFSYVLETWPDAVGAVTADSDGQHTPECIYRVREALAQNPDSLIMGVRHFDSDDIPWKSRFGNNLTIRVFRAATGLSVSDTQTGLRGIPRAFMRELLEIPENRFEFEMKMLLESIGKYPIVEVPIQTVYESKEDHQTHFRPVKDSARIYWILIGRFLKYVISSLSSSVIDLTMFQIFCHIFRAKLTAYIAVSTVLARIISSIFNYAMNYKVVFHSREKAGRSAVKYFLLSVIQMGCSALLVTIGAALIPVVPEVVIKIVVDFCLFFASYYIQKRFVFQKADE